MHKFVRLAAFVAAVLVAVSASAHATSVSAPQETTTDCGSPFGAMRKGGIMVLDVSGGKNPCLCYF